MKLALGTVQFGQKYGIANHRGQPSLRETKAIVDLARARGVNMLDTASAYGESEARLGEVGVSNWQVVSKLPEVPLDCADVFNWATVSLKSTLDRLKIDGLYGLLLHKPSQLFDATGDELYRALRQFKADGLVQKIGVSIYDPSELDAIFKCYEFDLVQAPFNLFDNRLIESGWLVRLEKEAIELHVRSIFLQGLLLLDTGARPQKFDRWKSLWGELADWLKESQLTPLQACLGYALSFSEISKVVVGVDSLVQLNEILTATERGVVEVPEALRCCDLDLISPGRWSEI